MSIRTVQVRRGVFEGAQVANDQLHDRVVNRGRPAVDDVRGKVLLPVRQTLFCSLEVVRGGVQVMLGVRQRQCRAFYQLCSRG